MFNGFIGSGSLDGSWLDELLLIDWRLNQGPLYL